MEAAARPVKAHQFIGAVVTPNPREWKHAVSQVEGFNAKLAVIITKGIGTMACAYVFAIIALISLPASIQTGSVIVIVQWVAQTFFQLVLLSIILVGQNIISAAADARSEKTFEDTEKILDRLDVHTDGGIKTILDAITGLKKAE